MSTKCTIAHGKAFHLYREVLDDDHVYLEMTTTQFEAGYGRVMVPIPIHVWEVIRHLGGARLDLVERTDDELFRMVENEVDERIAAYLAAERERAGRAGVTRILGSLVYGRADSPREKQIENGVEYFKEERKRQQEVLTAISALRAANSRAELR
jgi:hypothetical protein